MTEKEQKIIGIIEETLQKKLEQNPYFIRYTFYEIIDEVIFESLIRNKLYNKGYVVYFTGAEYEYQNSKKIVEDNELLVAIKKVEERTQTNGRKIKKTKHK